MRIIYADKYIYFKTSTYMISFENLRSETSDVTNEPILGKHKNNPCLFSLSLFLHIKYYLCIDKIYKS